MMNKLALKMLSLPKKSNNSSGFTLIELIVAAALSTMVLLAAGGGLAFMNQNNKIAKSETDRRAELNRALDFMADEIRQAQPTNSVTAIATDASSNLSTAAPNFTPTGKTPVLRLQLPGASEPVIYYLAAKPTGSPWFGPNIVYRRGPTMNNSGQYTDLTTPATWQDKPLVDSIVNTAPSTTPSCPSGWTLNPPSGSVTGFYTCVDSTGKIASLNLRGTQSDTYGTSLAPYEVSSKAFARPELVAVASSNSTFTTGNGKTTIGKPSNAYFEILGGEITCGAGGPKIDTQVTINITPPGGTTDSTTMPTSPQSWNAPNLAVGTKVTVTGLSLPNGGASNSCSGFSGYTFNSETDNGGQVLTLRNGDTVPLFTPFGGQRPIDAFLTKYIDASTGKVTIADNQVIYLFEVGVTDTNDKAYDMQDIVVLATISPNVN
jgi:prepilin-type N-terminal cleavage/methylation domain-containing protein